MQKKIIALALAAVAGSAAAQTNVQIYGVADVGYVSAKVDGKSRQSAIESGLLGGSRIGFKGTEDLGNGLKALFVLEYALAMDDNSAVGAADAGWSSTTARQQLVGLSSSYGTVVAGRAQTAGYDFACANNPLAGGAFDTIGKLGASTVVSCGSGGRRDNAVAYVSPTWAGFSFAVNHARVTEDRAAQATNKDAYANLLGAKYENGPLTVNAIYSKVSAAHTVAADDTTEYGLSAGYDFKIVKLTANYQSQKVQGAARDYKWAVAAAVPVTAAGTVIASYGANNIGGASNNDSKAYSLVYRHGLSKRTTLYAGYNHVSNDNAATLKNIAGTNTWGVNNAVAGADASMFGFGMNHAF